MHSPTWDLVREGMLHAAMWCSSVIAPRAITVTPRPVIAIMRLHHVTVVMLLHAIAVTLLPHATVVMLHLPGIKPGDMLREEDNIYI